MDYNAKYRPADLGDIIGQQKAVRQLRRLLQLDPAQLPHAYHFNGPTGVGKTSAARIFARHLETNKDFIWELDGAKTGNAEVNELARRSQYRTHSGGKRILIVDERRDWRKAFGTVC